MAGLFLASASEAEFAGVYAVEISPPRVIEGVSNGFIGFVGQFAWGPHNVLYTPEDTLDFYNKFEPAGSPRSSTGYRALMKRKKLALKVVRVLGAGSAAATAVLTGTGGNTVATAKYHGTLGNSLTIQQRAPVSGNAGVKDYVVTLTDAVTGTTQETFLDVPLPAGGVAVTVDVSRSKLLASLVLAGAMTVFPADATTTFGTGAGVVGSNGAAAGTSDYTGTAGLADKGVALFEVDDDIRVVCHDDCGNTNRAAINAAFASHAADKGDRMAVVDGNPDAANWSTVKGYVTGGLVTDRVVFNGAWGQVRDDSGTLQTSPWSTAIASAMVNLEPHQSHAWWDDVATEFYTMFESIVANFSVTARTVRKEAFEKGICLPIKLASGRYAIQHDRNTNTNPAKRYSVRRRVADYLALSLTRATPSYVNGPNVEPDNVEIKSIVDNFLGRELAKGRITAFATDIKSVNNATTLGLGEFYLKLEATSPAPREKIFFLMNVGPTVQITEQ
jgi:hypothetical protein